jgi:hypothetical protein
MKRFLLLVGVAAVAGAMYVAAAPGSRQSTAPTAAQFAALKKQVAALNTKLKALTKDEKVVKTDATAAVGFLGACFFDTAGHIENMPVTQVGTTSAGFLFGAPNNPPAETARTAIDIDTSGSPAAFLQEVTPACIASANTAAQASAHSGLSLLQLWAKRSAR